MKGLIWGLIRLLGGTMGRLLGGVIAEGRENVPTRGPVLLVSNHLCDMDPAVIWLALPRRAWFMAMQELFGARILGSFLRYMQAFPVRRDSADRSALRFAEDRLKEGEAVVIFPEGRGNPEGVMQPFQPGAALIALRTGAAVIPVGVIGTHGMLKYGTVIPRRSPRPVRVRFGPPVPLKDLMERDDRKEALSEATTRLEAAVAMLADQPPPDRNDTSAPP